MPEFLEIKNVNKSYAKAGFGWSGRKNPVLQDVSFSIAAGQCTGLIGESGSGKSTLTRLILGLEKPDPGEGGIWMEGQPVRKWREKNPGKMSVVFQDYSASVNPRYTVRDIIAEPLLAQKRTGKLNGGIGELLERVSLPGAFQEKYPHELSGGQLQRVCIARAVATEPVFLVLDEAISSLDVSVQTQVLKLLQELQQRMGMTYLFVAHDLQAVTYLCDKLVFLFRGRVVEESEPDRLRQIKHPYAKNLLASAIPFEV